MRPSWGNHVLADEQAEEGRLAGARAGLQGAEVADMGVAGGCLTSSQVPRTGCRPIPHCKSQGSTKWGQGSIHTPHLMP